MDDTKLDKGESAAICLYERQKEDALLLIDEKKGRDVAKERDIKIIGTIGLIALSYKRRYEVKIRLNLLLKKLEIKEKVIVMNYWMNY